MKRTILAALVVLCGVAVALAGPYDDRAMSYARVYARVSQGETLDITFGGTVEGAVSVYDGPVGARTNAGWTIRPGVIYRCSPDADGKPQIAEVYREHVVASGARIFAAEPPVPTFLTAPRFSTCPNGNCGARW